MVKVYSPSQTLEWSRCPFLWATQYKKGWRPAEVDKRDIAASLGVAFGAGMEYYNRQAMGLGFDGAKYTSVGHAKVVALASLEAEWKRWEEQGLDRSLLATTGDVQDQLLSALEYAILKDPTPLDWKVIAVEQPMGDDYGRARADVVYELPGDGGRVVRDYKFTLSVLARYVDERMNDYAVHPQSYHYAWMHDATLFIPTLIIASPRPSLKEVAVQRSKADVAQWLVSQKVKWGVMESMEAGVLPVWKSDIHKSQYGKCGLYDFCMTYEADESRLGGIGYIQVERKK